jgi:hypothetical protein
MSSAFVRENETQRLNEVEPTLGALLQFLRRENGGVHIRETKTYFSDKYQREVYDMSDGLTYAKNDEDKWFIILD